MVIAVTMRCLDPLCREACIRDDDGSWVHKVSGTPVCGEPEKVECAPHMANYTGRLWRIMEARENAAREAAAEARRIVAALPNPMRHCGDCDAGLRLSIEGALSGAFERALAYAQDEYVRPHPADRQPAHT